MKRTLFLSLLALAIFSTSASASHNFSATYVNFDQNYYSSEVQDVYPTSTDSLRYYNNNNYTYSNDFSRNEWGNTTYKKQKCVLDGDIQLGEDMAFYNVSIYAIEKNYYGSYDSTTLTGTKGTFFLNSAVTRLWTTPIQYSITGLDGVSLSGYTGYIDNENSAAYGLIAAAASNKHELLMCRNNGAINLSNNSVTSTGQKPLKHLYSSVFTAIDSLCIGYEGNSFIQLDNNNYYNGTAVSISGNKALQEKDGGSDLYYAHAGAIYASGSCDVSVSTNSGSVLIQNNQVSSAGSHTTGGAIAMHGTNQLVRLSNNTRLNLSGNKAISTWSNPDKSLDYITAGGAIYAPTATVSLDGNGNYGERDYTLSICNNSAEMANGSVRGGAIDAKDLTINGSQNFVKIAGNYAVSTNMTEAYSALGGALSAATSGGKHIISQTGDMWNSGAGCVALMNNYASSDSAIGVARGGFFYGTDGTTLEISENYASVDIYGNCVSARNNSDSNAALGGAIYGSSLVISDNMGDVNIYGNYEKYGNNCRMRAVYLESDLDTSTLALSATAGKSITFSDSIYADVKDITINGGSDGTGAVIFSAGNVERYFDQYAGISNPQEEDIAASKTSYFGSTIKVKGGTLEAQYGAVLQGRGMEVAANSGAIVRLTDASMEHNDGGIVRFYDHTTLAAKGVSTLTAGLLQMFDQSRMQFELTDANADNAALTYTGDISLSGTLFLNVQLSDKNYKGGELKLLTLTNGTSNWETGASKSASFQMGNTKLMGNLSMQGNTLVYTCWEAEEDKKIVWGNNTQDARWDNTSSNWSYDDKVVGHTGMNAIHFGDTGSGTITLCGTLTTGDITVENSVGKDYYWKVDSTQGASLSGAHGLTKRGAGKLSIEADMDYTGATSVENGTMEIKANATLSGDFTNNAKVCIEGSTKLTGAYSGSGETIISSTGELIIGTGNQRITSKGEGHGAATLEGSSDAGIYALDNTNYEISNAKVTVSGTSSTIIDNKLTDTAIVNNATKTLVIRNGGNTLSGVEASKGDIDVRNYTAQTLDELLIADGRTVGFFAGDNTIVEATITIATAAQFGKNTTLLANFELQSGATLMMTDTVSMGSDIILNEGAILEGDAYKAAFTLTDIGTSIVLFDSVDTLILQKGEESTSYLAGELTTDSQVLASTYFKNLKRNDLYITFNTEAEGQVCITMGEAYVIPEPATATLSLLTLAALAARRRRR